MGGDFAWQYCKTALQSTLGQTLVLEKIPDFCEVLAFQAEASSHTKKSQCVVYF